MDLDLEEQRLLRRKRKSSEAGNLQQLAETCRKLGELYSERGEHRKALNEYKLVAKAFHKLKMPMEVGRANRMIGEMFMLLDEFEKALQYEKVYLEIANKEDDKVELQRAYITIGRTYLLKGQSCDGTEAAKEPLIEAKNAFKKGLKLCRELKEVGKLEKCDMEARALLNLGVTKEHQGHLEEALEDMNNATKIAQNNDLLELLHQCYISSALLFYFKQNNHTKALKNLSEALEVASRLSNKAAKMSETALIKADVLIRMGDFQSAKQALKKAFRLKTPVVSDAKNIERQLKILVAVCRVEDELITIDSNQYDKQKILYEKMGDGACKLENYGKAIDYYLKMLECAQLNGDTERDLVPTYVSLYQTYKDNKQFDDALIYLWKEYDLIQDIPKEAYNTLLNIAEVYESQNRSAFETEDIYRRIRQEAKKMKSVNMERIPLQRCIAMLRKHSLDMMAENLEKEAKDLGINLAIEECNESDESNASDSENEQEETKTSVEFDINTPDIGDDVDLCELSDSDEDRSNQVDKQSDVRSSRKRGMSFQIKRNNKGETQLHQACIAGNKLLVQKLLEQGHPVNIRDHAGWLPLHESCIHGHKEIVELLLDKGAHINDKGGTSCDGITPLYDACSNGNLDVVELLLDRGANCTQRTDSGDTTLNVLELWFKGVQKKLLDENIAYYNVIRDRIISCFEKAGIKPTEGGTVPESMEVEHTFTETTRFTRRRANRTNAQSDSDSDRDETRTVRTVTSNRSSGYGSSKGTPKTSARKRPTDIVSDSDSDLEPDQSTSRTFREKTPKKSSGVDDYRNAIQVLRKGNMVRAQIVSPLKDPNPGPAKRGAYMRQEEVGDDWLVNDLGPNKKRQKILTEKDYTEPNERQQSRPQKRSFERELSPEETLPISDTTITSTGLEYDEDSNELPTLVDSNQSDSASSEENSVDAYQILMNASGKSFSRRPSTQSNMRRRHSSDSSFNRSQASLLDVGFNMSTRSDSPTIGEMEISMMSPAKSSTGQITPVKGEAGNETPVKILPPNMIRVIIEGDTIDVSYDEEQVMELNVGCLINDVVKLYGIKHGKRPLIKLLRPDGGLCMDTDPVTTLLYGSESIINSYLIQLEQMRSDKFYEDYCKHHDIEKITELFQSLGTVEHTGNFALHRDFFLGKSDQWKIVFQALGCEGRVRELNLSYNQLTDEDFQELTLKLPSLQCLEKLNLSMNCISHTGIANLSSILSETGTDKINSLSNALEHLTELDLSRNPLMDQSLLVLTPVCNQLKQLKILRLISTGITNLSFATPPLDISRLQVLDVSENILNKKSIDYLLTKLNIKIITELNFRSLGKLRDFKPAFTLAIQAYDFDMLRSLNLSNCGLTDADFSTILIALRTTSEKLKHLDVSFNYKLTQKSLVGILQSFTNVSLENVLLLQNPLILKSFVANDLMDAIEYDLDKCYPYRLELMVPLKLSDEQIDELRQALTVFWKRIWKERAIVAVNRHTAKLSMV